MTNTIKIFAFLKYGDQAASTRQRLLQYLPYLRSQNIEVEAVSLLDNSYVRGIGARGGRFSPAVAQSYARRMMQVLSASHYDAYWIHCELFPFMPGIAEKLVALHRKPIIYDFDDAIFHMYDTHRSAAVRTLLGRKLEPLLRSAAACACGNEYLRKYASRFCSYASVIPTVIDTDVFRPDPATQRDGPVKIGWIGSPSTWQFVEPVLPVLQRVCGRMGAEFTAIGAGVVKTFPGLSVRPWSQENEVRDLQGIHIGIMPLPDEPWARGKCGYKLIQYMACGLPTVASPVGVNSAIVAHGESGYLAATASEWEHQLSHLISDVALRRRMGGRGREIVESWYSLKVQAPRLEQLIRGAVQGGGSRSLEAAPAGVRHS